MSQVTTHILNTSTGRPAASVRVGFYRQGSGGWEMMAEGNTNDKGRITDLLSDETVLAPGTYKLKFLTGEYFSRAGIGTFYPYVDLVFEINSGEHYHVPLLLNPFGYSTYRGS